MESHTDPYVISNISITLLILYQLLFIDERRPSDLECYVADTLMASYASYHRHIFFSYHFSASSSLSESRWDSLNELKIFLVKLLLFA